MNVKRLAFTVAGSVLFLLGAALLVLPGPGLVLLVAGLALLARAFPRLERHLAPIRAKATKAAEDSVSSPWRVTGSLLAGAALIAAGLAWGLVSRLPFSGWQTGASLIASGLILFALLGHSYRRAQGRKNDE